MGLPVLGFPSELVDPTKDSQLVRVPFIIIKNVTYDSGAYVQLDRGASRGSFRITRHGLQPHLMFDI